MRKIHFITGPAGTGKSFKLRELLEKETRSHLVCAPTGIAAVNVGGSTIHRTFKVNIESGYIGKRWRGVEVVYIDEASMMGCKLFDAVFNGAPDADLVLVGDMAQLPPVKDKYWFQSENLKGCKLTIEKLTKQYRQAGDPQFSDVLNSIRNGSVDKESLRQMYMNSCHIDDNINPIVLAYRNDTVRMINAEKLLELKGEVFESKAIYNGLMKEHDCNAEPVLHVKPGALVVMLNNEENNYWNNGSRGTVVKIAEYSIFVSINSVVYKIDSHSWKMRVPQEITPLRRAEIEEIIANPSSKQDKQLLQSFLKTGIEYIVAGTCEQYPIKLAYALTVHKSQGMTLDSVHVITSGFAGCHGIGYVALSRSRTLSALSFDRKPLPNDFKFDRRLTDYI